jgi:hypothetical protein
MTTAISTQYAIAEAYVASSRDLALGLYLLSFSCMTLEFFEQIEPIPEAEDLHGRFLMWQRLGIQTLANELGIGEPANLEVSEQYLGASYQFFELMMSLTEKKELVT